jgi:hypothetical protein
MEKKIAAAATGGILSSRESKMEIPAYITMLDLNTIFKKQTPGKVVSVYNDDVKLKPFAFVLNISELLVGPTVEIAPGHTLRKANTEEVKFIKETINNLFGKHFSEIWEERRPKSGSGQYAHLPAKQWRYFVIEFGSEIDNSDLLEETLAIAPFGLEVGLTLLRAKLNGLVVSVCVYRTPHLFQSLSALYRAFHSKDGIVNTLAESDGQQISDVYKKLEAHDHKILDLHRTIELVLELKDLPSFSPLQILGYFAILESVLTHQPNPDDRYDSITRQITNKLALLNKRWLPQLDYKSFGGATHDKIWPKMYAYRSSIAHGGIPDFKSQLCLLKTAMNANVLIRDAVKHTVRHALVEPQLLADLRNC